MAKKRPSSKGFKKCVLSFLNRKTMRCAWGARRRMTQAISFCKKKVAK